MVLYFVNILSPSFNILSSSFPSLFLVFLSSPILSPYHPLSLFVISLRFLLPLPFPNPHLLPFSTSFSLPSPSPFHLSLLLTFSPSFSSPPLSPLSILIVLCASPITLKYMRYAHVTKNDHYNHQLRLPISHPLQKMSRIMKGGLH